MKEFSGGFVMIIALIGFMGSGKSSVGRELARRIVYQYYDTDLEVEKKIGLTLSEIFQRYGEAYFRQLEEEVLEGLVHNKEDIVISTGGGIVLSVQNRKLLKEGTTPILLKTSAEEIYNRIKDESHRPLLAVDDPLVEIKKLLKERENFYTQFNMKIETDGRKVDKIVETIINKFKLIVK